MDKFTNIASKTFALETVYDGQECVIMFAAYRCGTVKAMRHVLNRMLKAIPTDCIIEIGNTIEGKGVLIHVKALNNAKRTCFAV